MSNWCSEPLNALVFFQKGRKVDTSPFQLLGYQPYLGAGALSGKHDGYASSNLAVIATPKDILMLWDGERSGFVGYNQQGVVSSTVCKLTPTEKIKSEYLYYALSLQFDWIQNRRTGTGVPHVPKDIGRTLRLMYPFNHAEQTNISFVLQTIDKSINSTENLIKKYQQIKAGLMHDLFIRGIGADGKLRPTREQAPELYQETKIGWIPKDWNIDELQNLLAPVANNLRSGPFGSALLKHELVEDGIPFLGIDNIHVERFNDHFRRFVSEKKYIQLFKYTVKPRDVVITIMGTVGRCAVIPDSIDRALSSKHLWTITFNEELVIPELVCWQLNFATWVKSWFRKETQGGIMDAIQSKTLRSLILPIPPLDEQLVIFDRYKSISNKIKNESNTLEKLLKLKSGLMNDLLTGKVSVKVTSTDMEPENG